MLQIGCPKTPVLLLSLQVLETLVAWAKDEKQSCRSMEQGATGRWRQPGAHSRAPTAGLSPPLSVSECCRKQQRRFYSGNRLGHLWTLSISKECVGTVEWLGLKINCAESPRSDSRCWTMRVAGGGGGGKGHSQRSDALSWWLNEPRAQKRSLLAVQQLRGLWPVPEPFPTVCACPQNINLKASFL